MGPILWEKLTFYAHNATSEKLLILLHPNNGVLRNVRHIMLDDSKAAIYVKCSAGIESVMYLLIGALPKNAL